MLAGAAKRPPALLAWEDLTGEADPRMEWQQDPALPTQHWQPQLELFSVLAATSPFRFVHWHSICGMPAATVIADVSHTNATKANLRKRSID
jgi:hypothetical protein